MKVQDLPKVFTEDCNFEMINLFRETSSHTLYLCKYLDEKCILKINKDFAANDQVEYEVLKKLNSKYFPAIYKNEKAGVLLEYIEGVPLSQHNIIGTEAAKIFVTVTEDFHKIKSNQFKLSTLKDQFNLLFLQTQKNPFNLAYQYASEVAKKLLNSETNQCVLHGDLHHENVLVTQDKFKIIDPKLIYGERLYDFANSFYNPMENLSLISTIGYIQDLAKEYSHILETESNRILQYAYVHGILSSIWCQEDGIDPNDRLMIAENIKKIITI